MNMGLLLYVSCRLANASFISPTPLEKGMGPVMLDKTVKSWYDVTSFTNPFLNKLVKNDKTSSPPSGKLQVCMEQRSRMRLFLLCNLSNFKTAWTIIWEKKWSAIEPVFSGTVLLSGRFSNSSTCIEGSLKADHSNKTKNNLSMHFYPCLSPKSMLEISLSEYFIH